MLGSTLNPISSPDKLTNVVDVYMNSHLSDGKPIISTLVKETNPLIEVSLRPQINRQTNRYKKLIEYIRKINSSPIFQNNT